MITRQHNSGGTDAPDVHNDLARNVNVHIDVPRPRAETSSNGVIAGTATAFAQHP
ncbi:MULTISPECIES: hypothetical protein [unclassified Curtobacterium]|uniref:hypothetical protein n=1 Tax=unclassified Curtobacterium TaxID=257496 RepID=UPI0014048A62|nr:MULTISPECIES: hypothetical protein [unclassified Curtobacterium]